MSDSLGFWQFSVSNFLQFWVSDLLKVQIWFSQVFFIVISSLRISSVFHHNSSQMVTLIQEACPVKKAAQWSGHSAPHLNEQLSIGISLLLSFLPLTGSSNSLAHYHNFLPFVLNSKIYSCEKKNSLKRIMQKHKKIIIFQSYLLILMFSLFPFLYSLSLLRSSLCT